MFNFKVLMMSRYMLFFIWMMLLLFMGCSKKKDAKGSVTHHTAKSVILQGRYDSNADPKKGKKLIKKEVKKLDTVIHTEFDHLKDWVSNVGEAIEMME
jgi:hypothetical protein